MTLQQEIFEWAALTFPDVTDEAILIHQWSEVEELVLSIIMNFGGKARVEVADYAMMTMHLASRHGIVLREPSPYLAQWIRTKLEINKERTWHPPDANGVSYHIKET